MAGGGGNATACWGLKGIAAGRGRAARMGSMSSSAPRSGPCHSAEIGTSVTCSSTGTTCEPAYSTSPRRKRLGTAWRRKRSAAKSRSVTRADQHDDRRVGEGSQQGGDEVASEHGGNSTSWSWICMAKSGERCEPGAATEIATPSDGNAGEPVGRASVPAAFPPSWRAGTPSYLKTSVRRSDHPEGRPTNAGGA